MAAQRQIHLIKCRNSGAISRYKCLINMTKLYNRLHDIPLFSEKTTVNQGFRVYFIGRIFH